MDYITRHYKNRCEILQERVNYLKNLLEMEAPVPTEMTPAEMAEPSAIEQTAPPSTQTPQTGPGLPTLPNYPQPGMPPLPERPFGISEEKWQEILKNFKPFGILPKLQDPKGMDKPDKDGKYGDVYLQYLKDIQAWINKMMGDMKTWMHNYEKDNPRPKDVSLSSEKYIRWFYEMYKEQQKHLQTWRSNNKFPQYFPRPDAVW